MLKDSSTKGEKLLGGKVTKGEKEGKKIVPDSSRIPHQKLHRRRSMEEKFQWLLR